jgi:hypothetical protein
LSATSRLGSGLALTETAALARHQYTLEQGLDSGQVNLLTAAALEQQAWTEHNWKHLDTLGAFAQPEIKLQVWLAPASSRSTTSNTNNFARVFPALL